MSQVFKHTWNIEDLKRQTPSASRLRSATYSVQHLKNPCIFPDYDLFTNPIEDLIGRAVWLVKNPGVALLPNQPAHHHKKCIKSFPVVQLPHLDRLPYMSRPHRCAV